MTTIRLPDVPPDTPISEKAIFELPRMLEGEDRRVCHELLYSFRVWGSSIKTVGEMIEGLQSLSPADFRMGVDCLRERCGLKSLREIEVEAQLEQAQAHRRRHKIGELQLTPTGFRDADEAERDAARAANQARVAERRRQDERVERLAEIAAADERQRIHEQELDRLLPPHLRP